LVFALPADATIAGDAGRLESAELHLQRETVAELAAIKAENDGLRRATDELTQQQHQMQAVVAEYQESLVRPWHGAPINLRVFFPKSFSLISLFVRNLLASNSLV
jgi:hypothetical protein